MKTYRSFKDARKFVQKQNIKSIAAWYRFCKSGNKPNDIPATPYRTYSKQNKWKGWGDWLGTEIIATQDRKYRSFKAARKFASSLNLKSRTSWEKFCKSGNKPDDIPNNPWNTYKEKGWKGMGDFLGSGVLAPKNMEFWNFGQAKKFVRKLKITGKKDWQEFCRKGKRPKKLPSAPNNTYKKEWKGWGDFFGTRRIQDNKRKYRSFDDARKFVHKLKLSGSTEWRNYCNSGNKPDDIPSNPNNTYRKQGTWTDWGDWFGTNNKSVVLKSQNYLPWQEAKPIYRRLAKEYRLKNGSDWKKFAKSHKKLLDKLHLPAQPWTAYSKERVWRKMKNQ